MKKNHLSETPEKTEIPVMQIYDLLSLTSRELELCSDGLNALQTLLSDQAADAWKVSVVRELQSLDHITQMAASLSVLTRSLAETSKHGRSLSVSDIDSLPILDELKAKAHPTRTYAGSKASDGSPVWL